ncbi:hypothetical protein QJS66_12815 [Kocuria rhizophila]|nr:hypothetical protein QJS66_12815 [Kocuria rhizophila]
MDRQAVQRAARRPGRARRRGDGEPQDLHQPLGYRWASRSRASGGLPDRPSSWAPCSPRVSAGRAFPTPWRWESPPVAAFVVATFSQMVFSGLVPDWAIADHAGDPRWCSAAS